MLPWVVVMKDRGVSSVQIFADWNNVLPDILLLLLLQNEHYS